jgi:hypothetical protein
MKSVREMLNDYDFTASWRDEWTEYGRIDNYLVVIKTAANDNRIISSFRLFTIENIDPIENCIMVEKVFDGERVCEGITFYPYAAVSIETVKLFRKLFDIVLARAEEFKKLKNGEDFVKWSPKKKGGVNDKTKGKS